MVLEGEETIFLKRFSRAEIKAATHCTIHNTAVTVIALTNKISDLLKEACASSFVLVELVIG